MRRSRPPNLATVPSTVVRIGRDVGNVNRPASSISDAPERDAAAWVDRRLSLRASTKCRRRAVVATTRNASPSRSDMTPNLRLAKPIAFASMVSNTGSSSPGERQMTCSTSLVAVCCSSASLRSSVRCASLSRRVFSMAITAWSAKFLTRSICLSVNGRTSCR